VAADEQVRLAVRDWDHLVPLFTGQVRNRGVPLDVQAREVTPEVLQEPGLAGGETSFSRYVRGLAAGDDRLVGLPVFVMRGFRHRCVLVRADSDLRSPADLNRLDKTRIGLTGWPDSGNTWTRAALRADGLDLDRVEWQVGPLTAADQPGKDRVGSGPLPANVRVMAAAESLVDGLASGALDAVLTPFMPPGFFRPDSPFRHLYPDFRAAEQAYFADTGFVPGIHLIALKRTVVARRPDLPAAALATFARSKAVWLGRRRMLADTTPWMLAELETSARTFGADWMPYGVTANAAMTEAFCGELEAQGITANRVPGESVFAEFTALAGEPAEAVTETGEQGDIRCA
jgi:4,5-dihydroxyphthalate decarboxylase